MLRHIIPWWLAVVIVGRDLLLLLTVPGLRGSASTALPVQLPGQGGDVRLLYAFPLLLLGTYHGTVADIARPIAWAFTIWGTAHVPVGRRRLPAAVPGRDAGRMST